MNRFGVRRVVVAALGLISCGFILSLGMTTLWQLMLLWGVVIGTYSSLFIAAPIVLIVVVLTSVWKRAGAARMATLVSGDGNHPASIPKSA